LSENDLFGCMPLVQLFFPQQFKTFEGKRFGIMTTQRKRTLLLKTLFAMMRTKEKTF